MRADSRPWRGSQAPPEPVWAEAHCWCPARPLVSAQPAALLTSVSWPSWLPTPLPRRDPRKREGHLQHIGTFWAAGPRSATDQLDVPTESDPSTPGTESWILLPPGLQLNSWFSTVLHKSGRSGFFPPHPHHRLQTWKNFSVEFFQDGLIGVLLLYHLEGLALPSA